MSHISSVARTLLVVAVLASATRVSACDVCTLDFIGTSKDGRTLAFTDTCPGCESESVRVLRIVDVSSNRVVAAPSPFEGDNPESYPPTWRKADAAIDAKLAAFDVVRGLTGQHVVSHPLTDRSAHPHHARFLSEPPVHGAWQIWNERGDYELTLATAPATCARSNPEDPPTLKFHLAITNLRTSVVADLQADRSLPASRGCPFAYSIAEVYVLGDHVAVFLRLESAGFEGRDIRHLVVTGRLP